MDKNDFDLMMKKSLSEEQISACKCMNNMLLTACPGSGKTRTLTYKLAYLANYYCDSRRLHIAITYTNRASDEIMSRLDDMDLKSNNIWAGTIHKFCMEFIIRPYSMYSTRLKKGYRIIDEYVEKEYKSRIKKELNTKYNNITDSLIDSRYKALLLEKKEIDFDDILVESLKLLKEHTYIAENIASIISSLQVDEYQDTNETQYAILAEIYKKNKAILVSFIGDVNQAIYGNLGGVAKTKEELKCLFGKSFIEKHLTGCYRSVQRIVDYYSNYAVRPSKIESKRKDSAKDTTIFFERCVSKDELTDYLSKIIKDRLLKGDKQDDICVISPSWFLIFPLADGLRKKLPDVAFDAPDISPFKYDSMNPFYLLAKLTFMRIKGYEKKRKRYANDIIKILENDYGISISKEFDAYSLLKIVNAVKKPENGDGLEIYKTVVMNVMSSLKINLIDEEKLNSCYECFLEKTSSRVSDYSISTVYCDMTRYFEEKHGVVINTIHGVKGQEYKTVIAYGLLNGYLPHWTSIRSGDRKKDAFHLLYVLCSRAKDNLYLISESGRCKIGGEKYTPTDEIKNVKWKYT